MQKLLLLSCLVAIVVLPVWAARDRNTKRGFKRAVFLFFAFNLVYVLALRSIFHRLS